jgi:hypothetical protein
VKYHGIYFLKYLVLILLNFLWQNYYSIFNNSGILGLNTSKPSQCALLLIIKGFPMVPRYQKQDIGGRGHHGVWEISMWHRKQRKLPSLIDGEINTCLVGRKMWELCVPIERVKSSFWQHFSKDHNQIKITISINDQIHDPILEKSKIVNFHNLNKVVTT